MQFYDREQDMAFLRSEREMSRRTARFTVVSGRRRVGKTQLIHHALKDEPYIYLLVTRRSETEQCADFLERVKDVLPLSVYGNGLKFGELFRILMIESTKRPFTLVIDELQEFWKIDEGIFGEIQEHWDRYHLESKMNLIVCGSVNTLMNRIFFDIGQPLYGRSNSRIMVEPFRIAVMKGILADYNPEYTPDDLLALWAFTGGVARYVEELMDRGCTSKDKMIAGILQEHSFFLDEGKAVLVEEFGKDYGTYFSILASIARGITTRNGIEQLVGHSVGGYLTNLEEKYQLIGKRFPIYDNKSGTGCHYAITDNFFAFWFRFIFRNADLIELKRFDLLAEILHRDYDVFSGFALERYFQQKFIEERRFTRMGGWWDRKGQNEIDLVCENSTDHTLSFFEVKRQPERYSSDKLQSKIVAFMKKNPQFLTYSVSTAGLSLADM